jgi:hypothetical protein
MRRSVAGEYPAHVLRLALAGALALIAPHASCLAKTPPRWQAPAQPGLAGVGLTVNCSGARCPANPPEVGPECWWYSYAQLTPAPGGAARGSEGRLACERAGPHYFAAMNGLKLEVAAGPPPAELIDPRPLPVAAAPPAEPPAPAAAVSHRALRLTLLAGLLLLAPLLRRALLRGRIIALAWRYGRRNDAALLDPLARLARRRMTGAPQAGARFHLRNLDLARFGGAPLHPATARFLRRGCR